MKIIQKFSILIIVAVISIHVNAQKKESNGNVTISYLYKKEMPVEIFFQTKMQQSKKYKVVGKKLGIFFEKDNIVYIGKNLLSGTADNGSVKVDTLYTIPKKHLEEAFPEYQLEGEDVRDVIYKYLYKNVPGFSGNPGGRFIYKLDKDYIEVDYENVSRKYIVKKSVKYYFKINTKNLQVVDFRN